MRSTTPYPSDEWAAPAVKIAKFLLKEDLADQTLELWLHQEQRGRGAELERGKWLGCGAPSQPRVSIELLERNETLAVFVELLVIWDRELRVRPADLSLLGDAQAHQLVGPAWPQEQCSVPGMELHNTQYQKQRRHLPDHQKWERDEPIHKISYIRVRNCGW